MFFDCFIPFWGHGEGAGAHPLWGRHMGKGRKTLGVWYLAQGYLSSAHSATRTLSLFCPLRSWTRNPPQPSLLQTELPPPLSWHCYYSITASNMAEWYQIVYCSYICNSNPAAVTMTLIPCHPPNRRKTCACFDSSRKSTLPRDPAHYGTWRKRQTISCMSNPSACPGQAQWANPCASVHRRKPRRRLLRAKVMHSVQDEFYFQHYIQLKACGAQSRLGSSTISWLILSKDSIKSIDTQSVKWNFTMKHFYRLATADHHSRIQWV